MYAPEGGEKDARDHVLCLLLELTGRGLVDVVEQTSPLLGDTVRW